MKCGWYCGILIRGPLMSLLRCGAILIQGLWGLLFHEFKCHLDKMIFFRYIR